MHENNQYFRSDINYYIIYTFSNTEIIELILAHTHIHYLFTIKKLFNI